MCVLTKFVCQAQSRTHIYAASFGTKHMWGYFYGIDSSYLLEKVMYDFFFFFLVLILSSKSFID